MQITGNASTQTNHTTHTPTHPPTGSFIKRKIVVFPAVEQSLIWTRGARAAPNMNATVVQFTARITLMYWATSLKALHWLSVGNS